MDIGVNVSSATSGTVYKVKKPSGLEVDWTCTTYSTTSFVYTSTSNDLNESGIYALQVYAVYPDWQGRSETYKFEIYDLFD